MSNIMPDPSGFTHDDDCERHVCVAGARARDDCECTTREMRWIAREARTITVAELDSPRGREYIARKRALLAHLDATV
jgi:hypothetical protein